MLCSWFVSEMGCCCRYNTPESHTGYRTWLPESAYYRLFADCHVALHTGIINEVRMKIINDIPMKPWID